jgi:hypothetical protein
LAAGGDAAAGVAAAAPAPSTTRITEPSLTLSLTLTRISLTTPAWLDGISIEALSDSTMISPVSTAIVSPGVTITSITATSLKSPMSGTLTSIMTTPRPMGASAGPPRGRGPAWERPGARPASAR